MTDLSKISIEDMEKELEKRKLAAKNIKENIKPLPFDAQKYQAFEKFVKNVVDDILNKEDREDDKHYVYEEALQLVYGKDIFERLRKADKSN